MKIKKIYLFISVILALILSGCATIKLVGDYDEQTDRGITVLQKDMETFFIKLEDFDGEMAAPYHKNNYFYGKAKVAISSLRIRADAMERNSITVRMLDRLQNNFNEFAIDHKEGIHKKELPLYLGGFNSQFTAILTFELAKKRGEKPDSEKAMIAATPNTLTSNTGVKK